MVNVLQLQGRLIIFRSNGSYSTRFSVNPVMNPRTTTSQSPVYHGIPIIVALQFHNSDMAIAVYDIGPASSPDSHKKITNRFSHKSSILCVTWPVSSLNDFVYGLSDGSVMCGLTKMKNTEELYKHTTAPLILLHECSCRWPRRWQCFHG